jgi:arylsulfate sulfotransferase
LLHPLAKNGTAITDTNVLYGHINHPDFEWNWYQHATKLLPNGNLMLFDNGDNRNFTGDLKYSRAVEYKINENGKTVQQVWQYGKERGQETFSSIVSDVDYYAETNTVVFTPGSITYPSNRGKMVEVSRSSGNVVFEVTVLPPTDLSRVTMHRTDKIKLYR